MFFTIWLTVWTSKAKTDCFNAGPTIIRQYKYGHRVLCYSKQKVKMGRFKNGKKRVKQNAAETKTETNAN